MLAFDELQFLNDAIASGKREVTYQNPMEFDLFHYADAAIRLNLANEIDDDEMRDVIEAVKASQPSVEPSIKLSARYAKFANTQKGGDAAGR